VMDTEVVTVSDTLDVNPFPVRAQNAFGQPDVPSPVGDDAIRARLADVDGQEEKRRRLSAFFERDTPAWNPDDHPDIDAAGGAAAWVKKMRREADRASMRRSRRARP
jgi:hypothetical protein